MLNNDNNDNNNNDSLFGDLLSEELSGSSKPINNPFRIKIGF